MFAETAKGLVEVVSVNAAELTLLPYDLAEGVYVVGSGSTGAATGLGIMGELAYSLSWLEAHADMIMELRTFGNFLLVHLVKEIIQPWHLVVGVRYLTGHAGNVMRSGQWLARNGTTERCRL